MTFFYVFSRDAYLSLLKELIREQSRTKRSMFSYAVTGLLFPVVSVWYIISKGGVEKKDILIFVLMALCLTVVISRLFFLDFRAKMTLQQAERGRQFQPGYWSEHFLILEKGELQIRYGETELKVPAEDITAFRSLGDCRVLYHEKQIVEAIPESARTPEEWKEFEKLLADSREEKRRAALQEHMDKTTAGAVLNECFSLTPEAMAHTLAVLKRRSLFIPATWSKKQLFSLLVPLALAAYSIICGYPVYAILCLVILVCFNASTLMVFLPVYERMLLENQMEPAEEGYRLVAKDHVLYLYGRYQVQESPLKGLLAREDHGEDIFLYFNNQTMTFIPGQLRSKFLQAVGVPKTVKKK